MNYCSATRTHTNYNMALFPKNISGLKRASIADRFAVCRDGIRLIARGIAPSGLIASMNEVGTVRIGGVACATISFCLAVLAVLSVKVLGGSDNLATTDTGWRPPAGRQGGT